MLEASLTNTNTVNSALQVSEVSLLASSYCMACRFFLFWCHMPSPVQEQQKGLFYLFPASSVQSALKFQLACFRPSLIVCQRPATKYSNSFISARQGLAACSLFFISSGSSFFSLLWVGRNLLFCRTGQSDSFFLSIFFLCRFSFSSYPFSPLSNS